MQRWSEKALDISTVSLQIVWLREESFSAAAYLQRGEKPL
jgi:hypothetical protein